MKNELTVELTDDISRHLWVGLRARALLGTVAGAAALILLSGAAGTIVQAEATSGFTVRLRPGWNNVPYYGVTADPGAALTGITGHYSVVWYWDPLAQRYLCYRPGHDEHQIDGPDRPHASFAPMLCDPALAAMHAGRSYWIGATGDVSLTMQQPVPGLVPALVPGWNNFIYTGRPAAVDEALSLLRGHYTAVYGWDAEQQRFRTHTTGANSDGDLDGLMPYSTYWLYFT